MQAKAERVEQELAQVRTVVAAQTVEPLVVPETTEQGSPRGRVMFPRPTATVYTKNRCIFLPPSVAAQATNNIVTPKVPRILPTAGTVPNTKVASAAMVVAHPGRNMPAEPAWNVPENVPEKPHTTVVTEVRKGLVSERANAYIAMAAGGVAAAARVNGGSWRTIV